MLPAIVVFPLTYKLPITALPAGIEIPPGLMLPVTASAASVPTVVIFG